MRGVVPPFTFRQGEGSVSVSVKEEGSSSDEHEDKVFNFDALTLARPLPSLPTKSSAWAGFFVAAVAATSRSSQAFLAAAQDTASPCTIECAKFSFWESPASSSIPSLASDPIDAAPTTNISAAKTVFIFTTFILIASKFINSF